MKLKRCFRYSLATLLLVFAALGLALAPWVNRVHLQEQVIAEVERLGGSVTYEHQERGLERPDRWIWPQAWLGEKYFREIHGVSLDQCEAPIELLERISRLPSIRALSVVQSGVNDEALGMVGEMQGLKVLRIGFNPITDKGLRRLAPLENLVLLDLCATQITDAGLKHLIRLPVLSHLQLYGDKLTDAGARSLAEMRGLEDLDLGNTLITNEGLKPLARLPNLSRLRLDQMILGQGEELRINDDALPHLLAMPKLSDLSIVSLPISTEALMKLKRSKPRLWISK